MHRHIFIQHIEESRLIERDLRASEETPTSGLVVSASYLERRGVLGRLFGWMAGRPGSSGLTLEPPFDASGNDALDLISSAESAPTLTDEDSPFHEICRVRGQLFALTSAPTTEAPVVLRALWALTPPAFHICEATDFAIVGPGAPPVLVSLGLAPLVIARPVSVPAHVFFKQLSPRSKALCSSLGLSKRRDDEGSMVSLSAGDRVEALLVLRGDVPDVHRALGDAAALEALVAASGAPGGGVYRTSRALRAVRAGDQEGTRAVIRRLP